MEKHDLLIIGGAAVGTAAAVYGVRAQIDLKVLAMDLGGEVANSGEIGNWPGVNMTDGISLSQKFQEQLVFNHVPVDVGVKVKKIMKEGQWFRVSGEKNGAEVEYQAKAVVVGTGGHPRYLDIPGEKEFYQKGVTYCTTCDGPLFKGKVTVTIGGGNSAMESVIMMSGLATKVYLMNINPELRGENLYIQKISTLPNVEVISQAKTTKILGETTVTGLEYQDLKTGEMKTLSGIQGIFVHIGLIPNSDFISIAEKNAVGEIVTDKFGRTSVPGLFAAGDVTDIPYKQISVAAGQGVTALLSAQNYLSQVSGE